jgi:hypothetical protein
LWQINHIFSYKLCFGKEFMHGICSTFEQI